MRPCRPRVALRRACARDVSRASPVGRSGTAVIAALAKRATAVAKISHDRTLREARELVALVKERKADVTAAFYDIGEACVKLKEKRFIMALGRKSFAEVCEKDLSVSATTATRLI